MKTQHTQNMFILKINENIARIQDYVQNYKTFLNSDFKLISFLKWPSCSSIQRRKKKVLKPSGDLSHDGCSSSSDLVEVLVFSMVDMRRAKASATRLPALLGSSFAVVSSYSSGSTPEWGTTGNVSVGSKLRSDDAMCRMLFVF